MADDKTTTTPTPCLQGMPAGPHEDPPTGTKETLPQRGTQRSNAVAFLGNWSRGYALKILIAAVLRNKTHNQRHNAFEKWIQHTKTKIKTADLAACTVHTFLVEALRKWQCLRTINNEHRNTKNACGVLNARLNTQKKTLHFSCPHTENVTFRDPAYLCFRKGVKTTFLKKVLKYKVLKLSQGSGFFSFPVPFIQSFPWSSSTRFPSPTGTRGIMRSRMLTSCIRSSIISSKTASRKTGDSVQEQWENVRGRGQKWQQHGTSTDIYFRRCVGCKGDNAHGIRRRDSRACCPVRGFPALKRCCLGEVAEATS
jgi:hypothetical protein